MRAPPTLPRRRGRRSPSRSLRRSLRSCMHGERAGKPASGPVFPVTRGKRAGEARSPLGLSFAKRLRRDLFRAGVYRMQPIEVPATRPGQRTDLAKITERTRPAPNLGLAFRSQGSRAIRHAHGRDAGDSDCCTSAPFPTRHSQVAHRRRVRVGGIRYVGNRHGP